MASPPYTHSPSALSPPYPSHTSLPALNTLNMNKKRTAADGTPAPALKRRKASTMSVASATSAHPLRQTSFPPDEVGTPMTARSPSVDFDNASLISGSQVSAAAPAKKKRGRKSKADKAREQTPSVAGGRALTAVSGASGPKSNVGAQNEGAEDDDDAEGDVPDSSAASTGRTAAERANEKRLRAALQNCMDWDQFERHSAWRAMKLGDPGVKRLINATVSQSVPISVVNAVKHATKYFLTDLVAGAMRVQSEWVAANDEKQADVEWPGMVLSRDRPGVAEKFETQATLSRPEWDPKETDQIHKEAPNGPLQPDHIREAWRRSQVSFQTRGTGALTLWHTQQQGGIERFPVRTGGKRIFK